VNDLAAFVTSLVARARDRATDTESCSAWPSNPVDDRFDCWSAVLDIYRHNGIEHWTLSCRLMAKSSTEKDWGLLGRMVARFVDASGYPKDEYVEPVVPMEEAHPEAIHYWIWHSDGSDVDRLVMDTMHSVISSRTPRDPQAVAPSTPGRNDRCPCGSGKKFKKCHGTN